MLSRRVLILRRSRKRQMPTSMIQHRTSAMSCSSPIHHVATRNQTAFALCSYSTRSASRADRSCNSSGRNSIHSSTRYRNWVREWLNSSTLSEASQHAVRCRSRGNRNCGSSGRNSSNSSRSHTSCSTATPPAPLLSIYSLTCFTLSHQRVFSCV